eukprot:scaffold52157_cov13-Tisochrysis_lutea.AAC.1
MEALAILMDTNEQHDELGRLTSNPHCPGGEHERQQARPAFWPLHGMEQMKHSKLGVLAGSCH